MRDKECNKDSMRQLSVGGFIQQSLCHLIQREIRDPRLSRHDKLCLTITQVRVSRDLSVADVQVSFLQLPDTREKPPATPDTVMQVLKGSAGFLRSRLAKESSLRIVPALRFHCDNTVAEGAKIAHLLTAEKDNLFS